MMAGPVSDTIGHSNGDGELVRVSGEASKALQVDKRSTDKSGSGKGKRRT